ncbi:uncharacterized protein LOC142358375 [Convolutriloba macropyga]|uniref:uncharacterized protein LOC142358375 n=1 Tax=Convolutriloba macropyga TaxID=536237 RepID=UPI003F51B57B
MLNPFADNDSSSLQSMSVASDFSSVSSIGSSENGDQHKTNENRKTNVGKKESFQQTQQQRQQTKYQKTITASFFYVGLVFIIVSLPTSLFNAAAFWYLLIMDKTSEVFDIGFWISQTLYGLVFLINPCLYASSNLYVRKKVRKVMRRLSEWVCCCCRLHKTNLPDLVINLDTNETNISSADND